MHQTLLCPCVRVPQWALSTAGSETTPSRDTPVGRGALERHYRHRYRRSGGVLPDRPLTERSSASASSFCFRPGSVRFGVGFSARSATSRRRSDLCFAARVERGDR
jgi:hypothetical protein